MKKTSWAQTSAVGKYIALFLGGGIIYSLIEIIFRGYTHWSMTLTGGACLLIMYIHYTRHPDESIVKKCFFGMCVITFFEFVVGCIVNLLLGWDVWDYSDMYLNVLGQICPAFCGAWFLLSFPISLACGLAEPADDNASDVNYGY